MNVFLSYTRSKDQFNKVSSFRERLEHELSMRSPGSTVFQDTHNLGSGQHFPEELQNALRRADVFLALVSPAWLQSDWCRKEFSTFTVNATDAARLHRILPVLWVETPELTQDSLDVVAKTLANINYSDWRDLRYESWDEPKNQRQLGKLAESAIALSRSPVTAPPTPPVAAPTYRFKYGVRWTPDGTPLCNKCGLPLTNIAWATHLNSQVKAFRCSCNSLPIVLLDKGEPIHAPEAMKRMAEDHGSDDSVA